MSNKSVLMISPYFPPRKRVGSLRAFKFAKYLKDYGYAPVILSLDTPNEMLTEQELYALSGSSLYQFTNPFDQTVRRSGSQLIPDKNVQSNKAKNESDRKSISDFIDLWFPIDTWLPVLLPQLAKVSSIIDKHQCKIIWSTGDPWSTHVFARILSNNNDIPWVADFRDPWALCSTRYNERPGIIRRIDSRSESKVLSSASKIIFTAQTTEQVYRDHYPQFENKFETIYNSFDQHTDVPDSTPLENKYSSKVNLLFFGRFRDLSPAYPLMEILSRISTMNPGILDNVQVSHIGSMRQEDVRYGEKLNVLNIFKQINHISHDKSLSELNKADLLVLSTDPGRFEIIPAKLWDYLPSTTPIFSIAPNPEIREILKSTGRGVSFNPANLEESSEYLTNFIRNRGSEKRMNIMSVNNISKYSASETTARLAAIFDSLLE
jgi:hypothetical protein